MNRAANAILSIILIIISIPLLIIISILIKVTSTGPVIFKQKRIGKSNKLFTIYKFRTMWADAPDIATPFLQNPDKWITPIGRFLRRSSFDEIPQLFNILKGDMSLIGPRPALFNEYELINLRTKARVHILLPGITGWAQVNGRDKLSMREKVKLDKYYLENKSVLLDIKIIFMTFCKVVKREGIVEGCPSNAELITKQAEMESLL